MARLTPIGQAILMRLFLVVPFMQLPSRCGWVDPLRRKTPVF
jgi:hypothetical protein